MSDETPAEVGMQVTPPPPAGATEQNASSMFTQEQVNKFTGTAREEGRKSAEHTLLEKFGVKSQDEIAAILEAHRKSEADKLSEVDKVKNELAEAQAKREILEKENQTLKLSKVFDGAVKELNLAFVNDKAADDAFSLLDPVLVADETKGVKGALKQLFDERPYLFRSAVVPELDATKKNKGKPNELTDDQKEEIRKRFRI